VKHCEDRGVYGAWKVQAWVASVAEKLDVALDGVPADGAEPEPPRAAALAPADLQNVQR
jgi:hypothetical protein